MNSVRSSRGSQVSACMAGVATMVCKSPTGKTVSQKKEPSTKVKSRDGNGTNFEAENPVKERFYTAESFQASPEVWADGSTEASEEHDSILSASSDEPETTDIKVIFLDIDGPIAPWKKGRPHKWNANETVVSGVYARNTAALRRIVDGAGGPKVVKVVVSSNWRTDEEKYPWFVEQLRLVGIEVIGHTDVLHVYPAVKGDGGSLQRNLEIQRALHFNTIGQGGPVRDESGVNTFTPFEIPPSWKITSWIAIDDLSLDKVVLSDLNKVGLFAGFMRRPEDQEVGNGWLAFPQGFRYDMQAFLKTFGSRHFVHVRSEEGIAGTACAEELAVQLLQGN